MDDHYRQVRARIHEALTHKGNLQMRVFDNTFDAFNQLKEVLHEMASELNDELEGKVDKRVKVEYRDRGKFECQLQVAGDLLIFVMHTDMFEFERDNVVHESEYVADDPDNSYCGVVDIYNFLSDSFKYNRDDDEGYLIGRLFINHRMHYYVEGKRQTSVRHHGFGTRVIDRQALLEVIGAAVEYALDFDPLVPPYDSVKHVTVEQLNTKFEETKIRTGKRRGYEFRTDDV